MTVGVDLGTELADLLVTIQKFNPAEPAASMSAIEISLAQLAGTALSAVPGLPSSVANFFNPSIAATAYQSDNAAWQAAVKSGNLGEQFASVMGMLSDASSLTADVSVLSMVPATAGVITAPADAELAFIAAAAEFVSITASSLKTSFEAGGMLAANINAYLQNLNGSIAQPGFVQDFSNWQAAGSPIASLPSDLADVLSGLTQATQAGGTVNLSCTDTVLTCSAVVPSTENGGATSASWTGTLSDTGSGTITYYSGPNNSGPIASVDVISPNATEQVTYLTSIGGSGINVPTDSNIISATNGNATDTTNSITGSEWGINAASLISVINFGTITGGLDGIILNAGGTITNGSTSDVTATISSTSGLGINFGGANASQLTNFGIVSGGVEVSGTGTLTVTNGSATDTKASIQAALAGADGVYAGATTLENFGSIYGANDGLGLGASSVVNGSAVDTAASVSGGFGMVFFGGGTSTVNNFGSISASYSDAVRLSQGGSVTNGSASDTTASITGGPSGWGVDSSGGSVTNYGTITGSSGGVYLTSGTLINAGAITSAKGSSGTAVDFASGVSRLVEDAGSTLTGVVYGSGAGTTLELAAGKSGSVAGGLVNVGTIDVDAGASWTVTGTSTVPNVVDNNVVAIESGSSLDVSAAVDPSSSGYFLLTSQSTLEIAAYLGTGLKIQFIGSSNKLTVDSAANFGLKVGSASYAGPLLLGFGATDSIDLKGIAPTGLGLNYSAASGDLQITGSGGSALATLAFQNSSLGAGAFHAASDGAGGTLITHS
jgi:hypothetical protein